MDQSRTKACVLHVHYHAPHQGGQKTDSSKDRKKEKIPLENLQAALNEGIGLAEAINLDIVHSQLIQLQRVTSATYIGRGNVQQLADLIKDEDVEVVIFDGPLSPAQQRNLEKLWNCKVIDRTSLILEIFGDRARTAEGRLQVELATLSYQRTRLVRSWTHLERQRGGFGFTGGPGETQLELDRRMINERIVRLKEQLEKMTRTRGLQRAARQDVPFPLVALVGYTNTGKSTLFNRLTHAKVLAKDMLFATLDPTMRQIKLPSGRNVILSDTVGFISNLPTQLVAAFRATLEEVCSADLILHVRDASHPNTTEQGQDVEKILVELGLEDKLHNGSVINVYNKIDLIPQDQLPFTFPPQSIQENIYSSMGSSEGRPPQLAISAITGEGIQDLLLCIDEQLNRNNTLLELDLPATAGEALAWLYRQGAIQSRRDDEEIIHLVIKLQPALYDKFRKKFLGE